jgi:ligand-binding sensor domain-containing protein
LSRYDKLHDTWKHFQKAEKEERPPWEQPQEEEKKKEKRENELVDNNVIALSVGERYVWIATEGGVGRYDKIANRFSAYTKENKLPSADVRTIGESHSDVWIGTSNGLSKHSILSDDPNAWETYNAAIEIEPMVFDKQYAQSLVHDDVRCLAVDDNRIWIGTKTGVSLYDIKKGLWQTFTQKDGLAESEVSCIAVDGDIVWFGSGRGATSYNAKTQKWQTYHKTKSLVNEVNTVNDGLASNHITSIAVNKEQVWFGTFDKGVTILDKALLKWRTLTIMDGLPHNGILAIVMDKDNVWIGTHGGLVRYSISTETFTVYTEQFDLDGI